MGLGPGSNNNSELMALKLLPLFAKKKYVSSLRIFGDSMLVICWIKKTQRCHNIILSPFLDELFKIFYAYDYFSIQHVHRECNQGADLLSKEGLWMVFGTWLATEVIDGT
jgi:hypothetical protein